MPSVFFEEIVCYWRDIFSHLRQNVTETYNLNTTFKRINACIFTKIKYNNIHGYHALITLISEDDCI